MNRHRQPGADEPVGPASKRPLFVLHINDSTDDQVLFQSACLAANVPINWHVVDSTQKALSYLKRLVERSKVHEVCWPDLILLDIRMPPDSEGGFTVLKNIRGQPELQKIPVVVFTGQDNPRLIREALRLGAASYLLKPLGFQKEVELVQTLYEKWGGPCR